MAQAMLAKELGLRRVFLLYEQDGIGGSPRITYTDPFSRAAGRLGVGVAGSAVFDPEAKSYDALARRVARSGAQGVFVGGFAGAEVAARLVKALRARLGQSAVIMATEPLGPVPDLLELAGPAAHGLYMSALDVPPAAREESPAGRSFARDFGTFDDPVQGVLTAAQATDVVLDAIARSDGTANLGAPRASHCAGGGRPPGRLPARSPRGHHSRPDPDLPREWPRAAGRSCVRLVPRIRSRPRHDGAEEPVGLTMRTGTTFAGYRVEALVGRGGMGVVYRATDLSLERPVALKLIAPELAEDERFRRASCVSRGWRRRSTTPA